MAEDLTPLTILGVHLKSDGYPNVTYRLLALHECTNMRVREINYPFRAELDKSEHRVRTPAAFAMILDAIRFAYAHINVLVRFLATDRKSVAYLPYPALLLLLVFSMLPRALRPRAIAVDAFISVYDTVVNDRKLVRANSRIARFVRWLENRAYGVADVVIVDTVFNAQYFNKTFSSLRTREVIALPLSIDESFFSRTEYRPAGSGCHVVFLGTFVPLQGVDTIAKAAVLLADRTDIRITLVGKGQTAASVKGILSEGDSRNVEWITEWQTKEQIKAHINSADICLGIFGSTDKAQRVWPFKNYHYMAVGRPIITGDTECAKYIAEKTGGAAPFLTVPCDNASALAEAIRTLANSPGNRADLAASSQRYYVSHLSARAALTQLVAILRRLKRCDG